MTSPRIGIIIGSTRPKRFADRPAQWIHALAARRTDLRFELVDLRDHPLPFFDEPVSPSIAPPQGAAARAWAERLRAYDGYILLAAEYNHGPTAVLKNALDYAPKDAMARKPVAYVGYGGVGAARAIEQLRLVTAELQLVSMRTAVHIGMIECLGVLRDGRSLDDYPHLAQSAAAMLDELAWWAPLLRQGRRATPPLVAGASGAGTPAAVAPASAH